MKLLNNKFNMVYLYNRGYFISYAIRRVEMFSCHLPILYTTNNNNRYINGIDSSFFTPTNPHLLECVTQFRVIFPTKTFKALLLAPFLSKKKKKLCALCGKSGLKICSFVRLVKEKNKSR